MLPLGCENANAFAVSLGDLADLGDVEELGVAVASRNLDIDLPSAILLRLLELKIAKGQGASRDEEEVGRRVQSEIASRIVREITLGFFPAHTLVQLDIVRDGMVRWRWRGTVRWRARGMVRWRWRMRVMTVVVAVVMMMVMVMVMMMITSNKTHERPGGGRIAGKEPKSDKR